MPGGTGLAFLALWARSGGDDGPVAKKLRQLMRGEIASAEIAHKLQVSRRMCDCRLTMSTLRVSDRRLILLVHQLLESPAGVTGSLAIQLEERRKIARDLHDGTAPHLVAVELFLACLRRRGCDPAAERIIGEAQTAAESALTEMRALCYLLHPPDPSDADLVVELEEWVGGYSERSSLPIRFEASIGQAPIAGELRTAVIRIMQEALMNVHRHADASRALVRLGGRGRWLRLAVADDGKGIRDARLGVGIRSMRERVQEFGGCFRIRSSGEGTIITAMFPLRIAGGQIIADAETSGRP